jgi:type I restriction enzyme S subunit
MKRESFFRKFDQFADAPDALPKLRELILEFGVQGKLVPQVANDESAKKLLSRIRTEKEQLIQSGKMKRQRSNGAEESQECDSTVPRGWVRTTLGEVAQKITDGTHQTPIYVAEGIPFISVKDFSGGKLDFSSTRFISPDEHAQLYKRCDPRRGDILLGRIGTLGKAVLVDTDIEFSLFVSVALIRFSRKFIDPAYFRLLLNSPHIELEFDRIKIGGATHTNKLNLGDIHTIAVPLPPLAEQKRIVAKVDELMALCDRLEAQQQERGARHAVLARASLARLADAPTPANLEFLFHKSYTISPADLRKSILTLAVQGKLVPQDPNDESAEKWLSRLGLKSSAITMDGADGTDSSLPRAWIRVRFEDVALVTGGVTLGRKLGDRKTVTLPYLRVANVKRGEIDLTTMKDVAIGEDEVDRYALRDNDLLMTEGGDWDKVGRAAIWRAQIPVCLHQNHVFRARMRSPELTPFWFERYFNSPIGRRYFESASKQTTNLASINMRQVRNCPIPLPPLAEQRRIVAKVDQLMALVGELETQLAASRATAANLLDAVVSELTLAA